MVTLPTPSRVVATVVTGAGTAAYYATPDFISSRTARGWAKTVLTALAVTASLPELRAAWATARERQQPDGVDLRAELSSLSPGRKAVVVGPVAAVLAGSIGGVLMAERWAFRHGQARAAAGRRLPHTGPALLYGALASGLWLLPTPRHPVLPSTGTAAGPPDRRATS